MGFTSATIIAEQRKDIIQITTGCKELDAILDGPFLMLPVCIGYQHALGLTSATRLLDSAQHIEL